MASSDRNDWTITDNRFPEVHGRHAPHRNGLQWAPRWLAVVGTRRECGHDHKTAKAAQRCLDSYCAGPDAPGRSS